MNQQRINKQPPQASIRYSTTALVGRVVRPAESGITKAEVNVVDSKTAALVKQRIAGGLYDSKSPLVVEWSSRCRVHMMTRQDEERSAA